ncbi:hypothetical protein SBADM41S_01435 [Streptomyces badius]
MDAAEFLIELRHTLGIPAEALPVYLEEISSTLAGTAYKLTKEPATSGQLVAAGFQAVETGMTEGHPCFVANNGRLGFAWTSTGRTPPRRPPPCGWCGWRPAATGPPSPRAPVSTTTR